MTGSGSAWSLPILAAHSQTWSARRVQEFRDGVSSLLADVAKLAQVAHPALHLNADFVSAAQAITNVEAARAFAFAILDVTDYDQDLAFIAGVVQGAAIPCCFVCQGDPEPVKRRLGVQDARLICYESISDLVKRDSPLGREVSQAMSPSQALASFVYELWFPRNTSTIWVVCPQIHEPGEFADHSSSDYTYLDNLGDTDALLEIMVFLSRYYPHANVEKFSCNDLPRDHTKNDLVVIGGPGSVDEIGNQLCQEMMKSTSSRVSYSSDCERMLVGGEADGSLEFRAELQSDDPAKGSGNRFNLRRDYGYFARFPNPLNEDASVVLINGIHTAGVLGAARAFADRRESLRNYDSLFSSRANPRSFECHFEVSVLHGDVRVPTISAECVYSLGTSVTGDLDSTAVQGSEKDALVRVVFVAGDRGGFQRHQVQIPREFDSVKEALRSCEHRELFHVASPILAATPQKLTEAYRSRPTILHFAGHGDDRSLSFVADQGVAVSSAPIVADALSTILANFPYRVRLCVLNTCESVAVAKHLIDVNAVDAAIGWPGRVEDAVAIAFSRSLYAGLGDGLALSRAVALAAQACGAPEAAVLHTIETLDPAAIYFAVKD